MAKERRAKYTVDAKSFLVEHRKMAEEASKLARSLKNVKTSLTASRNEMNRNSELLKTNTRSMSKLTNQVGKLVKEQIALKTATNQSNTELTKQANVKTPRNLRGSALDSASKATKDFLKTQSSGIGPGGLFGTRLQDNINKVITQQRRLKFTSKEVKDIYGKLGTSAESSFTKQQQKIALTLQGFKRLQVQQRLFQQKEDERIRAAKTGSGLSGAVASRLQSANAANLRNASQSELKAFSQSINALDKSIQRSKIGRREFTRMFKEIRSGSTRTWTGVRGDVERAIRGSIKSADNLGAAFRRNTSQISRSFRVLDISLTALLKIGAIQLFQRAINNLSNSFRSGLSAALDYRTRIAEIRTISDEAGGSVEDWTKVVRDLSDQFENPSADVAEAAYQGLSNQVIQTANDFRIFGQVSLELAKVTKSTSAQSVSALSSVLNAYSLTVSDSIQVSRSLFKAVELGRFRLEEISNTLGNVAVPAAALNVEYEELLAFMSASTIQGIKADTTMTNLRNIFLKMLKPTEEMKDLFEEVGVSSGEMLFRTFRAEEGLRKIADAADGSSTSLAKLFGRVRPIIGALSLLRDDIQPLSSILNEIRDSRFDAFARAKFETLKNEAFSLRVELEKVRNFFIVDIGQAINRGLASLSNFVTLSGTVKTLAAAVAIATAALAGYTIQAGLASLANLKLATTAALASRAFLFVTGPGAIGLVLAGITAVVLGHSRANKKAQEYYDNLRKARNEALISELENQQRLRIAFDENLRQRESSLLSSLATQRAAQAKERNDANELFDSSFTKFGDTLNIAIGELKKGVSQFKSVAKEMANEIEKSNENIRKAGDSIDERIFDINIKDLDASSKTDAIQREVNSVLKEINFFTRNDDNFNPDRARELIDKALKFVDRYDLVFRQIDKSIAESGKKIEAQQKVVQAAQKRAKDKDSSNGTAISTTERNNILREKQVLEESRQIRRELFTLRKNTVDIENSDFFKIKNREIALEKDIILVARQRKQEAENNSRVLQKSIDDINIKYKELKKEAKEALKIESTTESQQAVKKFTENFDKFKQQLTDANQLAKQFKLESPNLNNLVFRIEDSISLEKQVNLLTKIRDSNQELVNLSKEEKLVARAFDDLRKGVKSLREREDTALRAQPDLLTNIEQTFSKLKFGANDGPNIDVIKASGSPITKKELADVLKFQNRTLLPSEVLELQKELTEFLNVYRSVDGDRLGINRNRAFTVHQLFPLKDLIDQFVRLRNISESSRIQRIDAARVLPELQPASDIDIRKNVEFIESFNEKIKAPDTITAKNLVVTNSRVLAESDGKSNGKSIVIGDVNINVTEPVEKNTVSELASEFVRDIRVRLGALDGETK